MDNEEVNAVCAAAGSVRCEQLPLIPLNLDVSGDINAPVPVSVDGYQCRCCGLHTTKLWQGARAGHADPHSVCTLCYLTGHLDSPTAAHGRIAFLPGLAMADIQHLLRRSLIAILSGTKPQQREGQRVWRWLVLHSQEVEVSWHTARACDFAVAMGRANPTKRLKLKERLAGCALILPADVFPDLSLLLPAAKSVNAALTPHSWGTYVRSDLYVEPHSLG